MSDAFNIDKAAVAAEIEMLRDMLEKIGKTEVEYANLRGQIATLRKIQRGSIGPRPAPQQPRHEETKSEPARLYA